jgi:pathogenesis-related protein 1
LVKGAGLKKEFLIVAFALTILNGCGSADVEKAYDDLIGKKKIVSDAKEQNLSKEIDELLAIHNQARADVGVDTKLKWSDTVARDAKLYADELARTGKWEHDSYRNHNDGYGHGNYGENLYTSTANPTFADAARAWANERDYYSYGKIGDDSTCIEGEMCGHYTQIIWRDTTVVGCAKSRYEVDLNENEEPHKGWYIIVCKYQLPGNVIGEYPY